MTPSTGVRVGTSGWQYRDWRDAFYPARAPARSWLEQYATVFDTVEVNNTFYRLPSAATFDGWRARVPEGFCFALKMSRYLTHVRRLRDPDEPVAHFLERAQRLGSHLGPVLVQLPPTMPVNVERLATTLRCFPPTVRVAVELRHPSWFVDEVQRVLTEERASLALTDRNGSLQEPLWRTTGWTFVRLHGGRGRDGNYGRRALRLWAERLAGLGGRDAYVYFNNDTAANAPRNAATLRGLLEGQWRSTRS